MIRTTKRTTIAPLAAVALVFLGVFARADSPWDLQAVDADGNATHPKVGAALDPANKVVVEGIALNATDEYLSTTTWQIYVQAESPDQGGIAAYAATWYGDTDWPRYPMDIQAGDRVRLEGYTMFYRGKSNVNERHAVAPETRMTVTLLASDVGLPAPQTVFDMTECTDFDSSRTTGSEYYQCQWVEFENVTVAGGTWAAGQNVVVQDDAGATTTLLLSAVGAFDSAPAGRFCVRGVFDQEDATSPYTGSYRLWIKDQDAVIAYPGGDGLWGLQAVKSDGTALHPKVGAALATENKAVIEGIALNAPGEILDPAQTWQVYVQAEGADYGGVAVYAATWYGATDWPRYPMDIQAGDRVRVEGYAMFYRGKSNINERHSVATETRMTVTKLASGIGMPEPRAIASIASCNYFDPRRGGGGERYQAQWVRLNDVHIVAGTWEAGQTLTISDAGSGTLPMLLSERGDFDSYSAPRGDFSVVGIFDQEDATSPYTGAYRLWVKSYADIASAQGPAAAADWTLYE